MQSLLNYFVLILTTVFGSQLLAAPGDLVDIKLVGEVPAQYIRDIRQRACPQAVSLSRAFGVRRYQIIYRTINIKGEETSTKGQVLVPIVPDSRPLATVMYQHGTMFARSELPSQTRGPSEGDAVGACFVSLGAVGLLADYLGFGGTDDIHPYLHADSEAWVARDLLIASKQVISRLGLTDGLQLFVAGYSQGGHAAMALLRLFEQENRPVTAAAPMAGPYHLSRSAREIVGAPTPHSAAEGAYLIVGLNSIYRFTSDLAEVFVPKFMPLVETLFDGDHSSDEVFQRFSMPVSELFQPDFQTRVLADPDSAIIKALRQNDVYAWVPRTPIRLYHGGGDHEVPFYNSQDAFDFMHARGANVQLVNLGDHVDHSAGFVLAIGQAALWFDSLF